MRMLVAAVVFVSSIAAMYGCGASGNTNDYAKKLDTIAIMLRHANENMALDKDTIQKRIDTMRAKLYVIDSVFPALSARGDQVALAYNVYRSALNVFIEYVNAYDALVFENQELQKELNELRETLRTKSGEELEEAQTRIADFRKRSYANYMATKVLIRKYIDIIRPYYRKKKIIDHMFLKLVENNLVGE
ncbi:hypothetical protein GC194_03770 [bacterium]|nr:hypothetical protein [bacterium]